MRIIGFNLTKISIERKEEINKNIEIKQNIDISDISEDKINISTQKILKIRFKFNIDYEPDIAKLEFQGVLLIMPEKLEHKKIIDSWKSKKIPNEFKIPIFNFIMNKCNIKSLTLEDELNLPIHLQKNMPKIGLRENNSNKQI